MSFVEAVILGIVQGLTEFLPISSTAHLRIAPELFGWPDPGAAYSAVIQLGTVAAVVIYFWRDLVRLVSAWFSALARRQPFSTVDARLAWFVLIGTIPIGLLGLLLKKRIETSFRSLYVIASSLILLAIVLWVVERVARHRRTIADLTMKDAVVIGLCQAVALIPGSSRSGTTITGGLALGLKREDAARYSFLLSIPATTLAGLLELRHIVRATDRPSNEILFVGIFVSFLTGIAAIAALLRYLRTHSTMAFVVYRIILGVSILLLLSKGVIHPGGAEGSASQHEQSEPTKSVKD